MLVLSCLAVLAFYFINKEETKERPDRQDFTIKDTAAVDRIFLADRMGNRITLTRQPDNRWMMNDQFLANQSYIDILLTTIRKMEVKNPVPLSYREVAIKELATTGTKVEIYKDDELFKTFYVGGNTQDELGTYMQIGGAKDPYVVHIPGFNGYLNTRFDANLRDWKTKEIVPLSPGNIASVSIEYPQQPEFSFILHATKEGEYHLANPSAGTEMSQTLPPPVARTYLGGLKNLQFEGYVPGVRNERADSLWNSVPIARIAVTSHNNQTRRMRVFPSATARDNPIYQDRMYLMFEESPREVTQVQQGTFSRLLKTYPELAGQK